jgi:hypothetical protein
MSTVDEQTIESGLNTEVECDGRRYHVQTQCSKRGSPVIESLVFQGGQALVRITSSHDEIASRAFGRQLLELQHADLIRKIRHGMLRDDEATAALPEEAARIGRRRLVVRIRLPF